MSGKKFDVLVVGELNIDLILNDIEKQLEIGKEIFANQMHQTLGSSSAIFANNLSVLGANVSFLGMVGDDSYGVQIREALSRANVDISNLITSAKRFTGITIALNYNNDRAAVTYPGAMYELKITDIADEVLQSASHLHVSSIFFQPGLKPDLVSLFKRAKELGLTTSLDPQWDPNEKWDIDLKALLPFVDVFLPNEVEIQNLTGISSVSEAVKEITQYSNYVVAKCGTKGSIAWDKTQIIVQDAYLNADVVDAIGAGDSFDAGFICKFIKKDPFRECLNFATLTGAVNTTGVGGTGAFSSLEDVESCIKNKFLK